MIEALTSGFLVDAPGAGWWALALAVVVFVVAARAVGPRVIIGALLGGLIGAWLADALFTGRAWPLGLSLFGAALGGPLGVVLATRRAPLATFATFATFDRLALPALYGAFVARAGCLLAGCELGRPAHHALAVRYAHGTAAFDTLVARGELGVGAAMTPALDPIPLYEMGVVLATIGVVALVPAGLKGRGVIAALAASGYFAGRALLEGLRAASGSSSTSWLVFVSSIASVAALGGAFVLWRITCPSRASSLRSSGPASSSVAPPTTRAT